MSFNSKNLEKLKAYGKTLSSSSTRSKGSSNKAKNTNTKLHPIETEEDPKELFKELMKASPNGEVPLHFIKRLRELEGKQTITSNNSKQVDINEIDNAILTVLALVSENNHSDFKNELEKLAKDEKNIKIREFAMKILAEYY